VLETLGPPEQAREVLAHEAGVLDVRVEGGKLLLGFAGKREDLPALHKKLVEAGVPVVAFFPKAENLEDLFKRLSTGATN
jgi:hypothetical protein